MARHRMLAGRGLVVALALAGAAPACLGNIGDREGGNGSKSGEPPIETKGLQPAAPSLRRLLARQYVNAIRDLLGDAAAQAAAPPADTALNGFDAVGASQLALGDDSVKKYEESARAVAAAAMGDSANIGTLVGCTPTGPSDAKCHEEFVGRLGRLLWRRPLVQEELDTYVGVAQLASTEFNDFYSGVEFAMATLLQSPNFLYQVEIGAPFAGSTTIRKLTGLEAATRMSFFLLDTTPSAEMLDAADAGKLDDEEGIRAMAKTLLEQDGARAAVNNLYSEVFRLRELDTLTKDSTAYPQFSPVLAQAMKEETLRLIEDLVWERDADFRELLTADYTFVNSDLAGLYGVEPPALGSWTKVDLDPTQGRSGLLGQASFLSLYAHVSTTSPTLRGKFVRERLLCQSIPAPPNNVNTTLPEGGVYKTMKEKLAAHQENDSCAGCHKLMDNIGLGFENFDAIGVYRDTENGVTLDVTGDVSGEKFDGVKELAAVLAAQPDVGACIVRNVYRHSMGHIETTGEAPAIDALVESFEGAGYSLQELLVELVSSEAFRLVGVDQ